jgi:hypothetical protein
MKPFFFCRNLFKSFVLFSMFRLVIYYFYRLEAVVHKTFHRYVVRAKRGTVQSVRDNKGSAPKSGGASLRRYNEAALAQVSEKKNNVLGRWNENQV